MITGMVYATFEDAYIAVLDTVRRAPQHQTQTRAKTAADRIPMPGTP